jgi:hypothetical protein
MATVNGSLTWGIVPLEFAGSPLPTMSYGFRSNYLKSANDSLRYQIQWFYGGINEQTEPSSANYIATGSGSGDCVNVIFKIETSVDGNNWDVLGRIKKSRDIVNKRYQDDAPPEGHRFTVDVSQLVADELSYSLCPINKGTWQSNYYGGLNGGLTMQDNVIGSTGAFGQPVSDFNVSKNGSFRKLKVSATFEIIDADGFIEVATDTLSAPVIAVINSVNQFDEDAVFYSNYTTGSIVGSVYSITNAGFNNTSSAYDFLTRCPNDYPSISSPILKKPVRLTDEAEFLQFFIRRSQENDINDDGSGLVSGIALKVKCFDYGNTSSTPNSEFYLIDCNSNALTYTPSTLSYICLRDYQQQNFIQNVSPYFINNTAELKQHTVDRTTFPYWDAYTGDKITDNTEYYTVALYRQRAKPAGSKLEPKRVTKYRYFYIDREVENTPYEFVRFHWLNSMGGIDSYTAKRNVVEGYKINKNIIERKSRDRTWYQSKRTSGGGNLDPSAYVSDTMRGGDLYKGGREVQNVNVEKNNSVYTEPLNKATAKWLKEMLVSPNVWIEMNTSATQMGNVRNPYLRPSEKGYMPIIITNNNIDTVNQEEGLVSFNIDYTLSHKFITQRN